MNKSLVLVISPIPSEIPRNPRHYAILNVISTVTLPPRSAHFP